jgi:Mlc titration factor MtfA (ptsG expression regulator)
MQILPFLSLLLLTILLAWRFWPKKKVKRTFPEHWHKILLDKVLFYRKLSAEQQQEFQKRMMNFLNETHIEWVNTQPQEEDEVLLAASAVIPVFGFPEWHYDHLQEVLLYPDRFNDGFEYHKDSEDRKILGMVGTGYMNGKMILSRRALKQGFQNYTDKKNTAIHEFIHLVDKADGDIDGLPKVLMDQQYTIPWLKLIYDKMEAINSDESDIRHYGGTSQIEFFAVASEYFFERPDLLKRKHPDLYQMLAACFQQEIAFRPSGKS